MEFTPNDLVDLKKALVSCVTTMSVNGRTVSFQSADEIRRTIADIEKAIAAQDPEAKLASNKVTASWSRY